MTWIIILCLVSVMMSFVSLKISLTNDTVEDMELRALDSRRLQKLIGDVESLKSYRDKEVHTSTSIYLPGFLRLNRDEFAKRLQSEIHENNKLLNEKLKKQNETIKRQQALLNELIDEYYSKNK